MACTIITLIFACLLSRENRSLSSIWSYLCMARLRGFLAPVAKTSVRTSSIWHSKQQVLSKAKPDTRTSVRTYNLVQMITDPLYHFLPVSAHGIRRSHRVIALNESMSRGKGALAFQMSSNEVGFSAFAGAQVCEIPIQYWASLLAIN